MKSVVFGALALTSAVLADHAAAGHHWGARAAVEVEASASLTASATKHAAAASTVTAAPKIKAAASTAAGGSASALPLTQYTYSHDEIPYKVRFALRLIPSSFLVVRRCSHAPRIWVVC